MKISKIIMKSTYDDFDPVETCFEVSTDELYLPDLLKIIERFLRATGWHFDGTLEIVKERDKNAK